METQILNLKPAKLKDARTSQAYTLVEVLMSVGILAIMVTLLYAGFISGFGSITTTREELRASQIMTQKLEAIRLLTWSQLSNCPTSFQEYYNPPGITNNTAGTLFSGTLSPIGSATNIPNSVSYKANLHLITVTVTWTNNVNQGVPIAHSRQMQTLSAYDGLYNYIFGKSP